MASGAFLIDKQPVRGHVHGLQATCVVPDLEPTAFTYLKVLLISSDRCSGKRTITENPQVRQDIGVERGYNN